jgi:hypothetical protein
VNLAVGGSQYTALIRDVQYDPLSHAILHLDFQHISLSETIEVKVAVHTTGLPIGVKDGGGILETILRELDVRCLPTAIPPSISVDVSHLNIGDSVHVREISVPDVTILNDGDETVATVVPPTVMEEKAPEAVVGEAAPGEPEVIAKGKKEDEGRGVRGQGEGEGQEGREGEEGGEGEEVGRAAGGRTGQSRRALLRYAPQRGLAGAGCPGRPLGRAGGDGARRLCRGPGPRRRGGGRVDEAAHLHEPLRRGRDALAAGQQVPAETRWR